MNRLFNAWVSTMAKEVSCCDLCLCVGIISEKKDTSVKIHILNQCLYVSVLREVAPLKNKMPDEVKLPDLIPFYLHCFEVKLIEYVHTHVQPAVFSCCRCHTYLYTNS